MLEQIKKLIDVKSIMTLLLTFVFCILTIKGNIPQEFLTIYTVIVSFYFGTQVEKNKKDKEE